MAAIDINRGTSGVRLDPVASAEIWQAAQESSAVMRHANQTPMAGPGVAVDVITGDPTATWTGESEERTVSRPSLSSKIITPYEVSVIVPMSKKFTRDKKKLADEIIKRLPKAVAKKFDTTIFGLASGAPGSNFDVLGGASAVGINGNTWAGLVAAQQAIATAGGGLDGFVLSPQAIGVLLNKVDTTGRPLFMPSTAEGSVPRLLGQRTDESRHVYLADADGPGAGTVAQLGYAADWSQAHYGIVEDISIEVSNQATINDGGTQINLWQRGMIAVMATFEVGFRIEDINKVVKLTSATQA